MRHERPMFAVDKKLIEEVVNYLTTRPWREVHGMIAALSQVKPITMEKQPEVSPDEFNAPHMN